MIVFLILAIAGIALVVIGAAVDGLLHLMSAGVLLLIADLLYLAARSFWRSPGAQPADRLPNAPDPSGPDPFHTSPAGPERFDDHRGLPAHGYRFLSLTARTRPIRRRIPALGRSPRACPPDRRPIGIPPPRFGTP